MTRDYSRLIASAGLAVALAAVPSAAFAQGRGRAVPRAQGAIRATRPVVVAPYRPYYYARAYRPSVNLHFFYGYPGFFGSYAYGRPYAYRPYGYYPYAYGSGYGYSSGYGYGYPGVYVAPPYGYGYGGYSGSPYGGVRIDLPQRDAEVFVDGYFVGTVDNFDGVTQQANIEAGPHRIEIRAPGFETIAFDVNVEPGRTITYRASMRPALP